MEDIVLTLFRFVGAFFRMLFQFFIMDIICFSVGWVVSKVFTLGVFLRLRLTKKSGSEYLILGLLVSFCFF